jgi:hypothetical protein
MGKHWAKNSRYGTEPTGACAEVIGPRATGQIFRLIAFLAHFISV